MKKSMKIAIGVIMGCMVINGCMSNSTLKESKPVAQQEQQQKTQSDIAYEKFENVQMRSSYDQVKQVLGVEGTPTSSNTIGNLTTEGYDFNVNGVHMRLQFQNGELSMKHINGGHKASKNVTLEKYNKVQVGMKYDQVKQIFECDGSLSSVQQYSSGTKFVFVMWRNAGGSFATIQFDGNGNVKGKVQAGLH